MKTFTQNLLLCLLTIILSMPTEGQIVQSNCTEPKLVVDSFMENAAKLAVTRLFQSKSADTAIATINPLSLDSTLTALVAVYNALNMPARDTVFNLLKMRVVLPNVTRLIIASTDPNWTSRWSVNTPVTGFQGIDSFILKYRFRLVRYSDYFSTEGYGLATFESLNYLNIRTIVVALQSIKGIRFVEGGSNLTNEFINGPSIYYDVEPNGNRILTFDYRWGDGCPAGCEKSRKWKFRIYPDCRVEYLGVTGKALDFVITTTKELRDNIEVNIFPNPTKNGVFNILFTSANTKTMQLIVRDIFGRTVHSNGLNCIQGENFFPINLRVASGIYMVSLYDGNKTMTQKVAVR